MEPAFADLACGRAIGKRLPPAFTCAWRGGCGTAFWLLRYPPNTWKGSEFRRFSIRTAVVPCTGVPIILWSPQYGSSRRSHRALPQNVTLPTNEEADEYVVPSSDCYVQAVRLDLSVKHRSERSMRCCVRVSRLQ